MQGEASYRIKVKGRLDEQWGSWFGGMQIAYEADDEGAALTLLECGAIDQSALHGLLIRLRDLNLPLVSVERIEGFSQTQ